MNWVQFRAEDKVDPILQMDMRRFGLILSNTLFGVSVAMAFGLLLWHLPLNVSSLGRAFLDFGLTGLLVGTTVGIGATVGPRALLTPSRCLLAQAVVAISSGVGGFIGSLFPHVVSSVDHAVHNALADRGILVGSWLGAALGTALEIVHVYRMRRRESRTTTN
jgi:hypothetical protein